MAKNPLTGFRSMKHPLDWPEPLQRCIVGIEVITKNAESGDGHTDTVLKVKLVNPTEVAKLLRQHRGLFVEKHEHSYMHAVGAALDAGWERSRQRRLAELAEAEIVETPNEKLLSPPAGDRR